MDNLLRVKDGKQVFVTLEQAVALDWKWVHESLIRPACRHSDWTFQSYGEANANGDYAVRRVCLSCKKAF